MKKSRGFSLIELMIVVAIIGILAAVAYPSYQNSVIKGNRANAKAFMMDVVQREQQYLLDKRAYATGANALADLNMTVAPDVARFYDIAVDAVAGPPAGFVVTATPKERQVKDGPLTISNTGVKTPADKW